MLTYSQYYKLVDQALDLFENNIKEARQFTMQQYQVAIDRRWTSKTTREKIVADLRSVGSLYPYVEKHKRMYF